MATQTRSVATQKDTAPPMNVWILPVVVGWLSPGGGHFLLKNTGRAALIFVSVAAMFILGLLMRGMIFTLERGDILTTLINYGGFACDLANGAFYLGAKMFGYTQGDVAGHVHDYGTKFLVTAGLLNVLSMVDAYEIAARRKD